MRTCDSYNERTNRKRMYASLSDAKSMNRKDLHAIEWFQLSVCKRLLINLINI